MNGPHGPRPVWGTGMLGYWHIEALAYGNLILFFEWHNKSCGFSVFARPDAYAKLHEFSCMFGH